MIQLFIHNERFLLTRRIFHKFICFSSLATHGFNEQSIGRATNISLSWVLDVIPINTEILHNMFETTAKQYALQIARKHYEVARHRCSQPRHVNLNKLTRA